jgi:hypothetical protein
MYISFDGSRAHKGDRSVSWTGICEYAECHERICSESSNIRFIELMGENR